MIVFKQIEVFFVNFWTNYGLSLILSAAFVVCGFFALKILKMIVLKALNRVNVKDQFILNMVKRVLRIAVCAVVGILILRSFNVTVSSVFLGMSPMFLTFGLGFKNFISNLIKGVQLKILNPYSVGDVIEVDGIRGKVDRVDFLYTYLHTAEGGFTTIANSQIVDKRISNFTKAKSLIENFNFENYRQQATKKIESTAEEKAKSAVAYLNQLESKSAKK